MTQALGRGHAGSKWAFPFVGSRGLRAGWRLLLFVAVAQLLGKVAERLLLALGVPAPANWTPRYFIQTEGLYLASALATACGLAHFERRPWGAYGLPFHGEVVRRYAQGLAWGIASVAVLILLIVVARGASFGGLALHGNALASGAILWGVVFLFVGLSEEFVFRGYSFFTLSTGMGFWPAAVLLSTLFGAVHYFGKPMENGVDALSVGLIGLFLCLTLRRTGNLWFAIGFHAAFDYAALFVLGAPNTGNEGRSLAGHLLNVSFHGPDWLTGGPRGIEASACVFVVIAALFWLFDRTHRTASLPRSS